MRSLSGYFRKGSSLLGCPYLHLKVQKNEVMLNLVILKEELSANIRLFETYDLHVHDKSNVYTNS